MRALVTGSAGFIGRHFAQYLLGLDWDVTGIDPEYQNHRGDLGFTCIAADCRSLFEVSPETDYDLVVHCAAIVGGRAKIDGDPLAVAENLAIDQAMFRWALKARPRRVVYFSSSAAYPVLSQDHHTSKALRESLIPINGERFGRPDQTYGWAKLSGEVLAREARRQGLNVHVFRPFSGYGEDQSLDYPFPSFIDRACREVDEFDIWGNGLQVRDWIHVQDIIAAVMRAIWIEMYAPVNLGTGTGTSMIDLANMVLSEYRNLTGRDYYPERLVLPNKPAGVEYRVADIRRLRWFFDDPFLSLSEGIAKALEWRLSRGTP